MPRTYAQLRAANTAAGQHFFDAASMRFSRSRLEGQPYAGDVFVTSEQFVGSDGTTFPRAYTVRRLAADGSVDTLGEFQQHPTLEDARRAARLAAHERIGATS